MKYIAYIDGSHHTKSRTSGWGFVILEGEKLLHECYGSVPEAFEKEFEYYAFAKLVQFCLENKIDDILMHTDLLGMEKSYANFDKFQIVEEAKKYIPVLPSESLTLEVKYISRKYNTLADKLSRSHLMNLYQQERDRFLKRHGQPGSNKINFLHLPELLHSSRTMLKSTESRVLHAVKKHHLVFELFQKTNILRILWQKGKESQDVLETVTLKDLKQDLFDKLLEYSHQYKKILLIVEEKAFFDQLAGLKERKFTPEELKKFNLLLDSVQEVFLHHAVLYPAKKKNKKKDSTFKTRGVYGPELKPLILERAKSQEKFFNIVMSWDIKEFVARNNRKPDVNERSELAHKRKNLLGIS